MTRHGAYIYGIPCKFKCPSTSPERFLVTIRRIVQALRLASRTAEKELGVSGAQLFVLQKLGEGGALSINELAGRTFTHQSSVSVVASRLVKRRLIRRSRGRRGQATQIVELTPAGWRLLSRTGASAQEKLLAGFERLSVRERTQLSRLLSRVTAAAGLGQAPAPMFFEEDQ